MQHRHYLNGGDSGYAYPWDNDWDCERCNNSVKPCDSDVTTAVTLYEGKGDSPCGVVDMAGNVWEWCRTAYKTGNQDINGTDVRVLRGGSWDNYFTDNFRCDCRDFSYPYDRNDDTGYSFRPLLMILYPVFCLLFSVGGVGVSPTNRFLGFYENLQEFVF
ncbi:MAG: SUMF1/EgtB/PvdO family nonheme iron enzyme [Anaerolineae bacterium]|nr:SUMF1/EgtB/PvdO family nonheme iron enzyme [Anaerolineae bacterium]